MIDIDGATFRTLNDKLYANGERVIMAHKDGVKVYPDEALLRVSGMSVEQPVTVFQPSAYTEQKAKEFSLDVSIWFDLLYAVTPSGDADPSFDIYFGDKVIVVSDAASVDIVSSSVKFYTAPIMTGTSISYTSDYFPGVGGTVTTVMPTWLSRVTDGVYEKGPDDDFSGMVTHSAKYRDAIGDIFPGMFTPTPCNIGDSWGTSSRIVTGNEWENTDGSTGKLDGHRTGGTIIAGIQLAITMLFASRNVELSIFGVGGGTTYGWITRTLKCRCGVVSAEWQ